MWNLVVRLLFNCYTENLASNVVLVIMKEILFLHGTRGTMRAGMKRSQRSQNKVLNALLCAFKSLSAENMFLVAGAINEE